MYFVAATISFDQSAYSIAEDGGLVQPVLVLNNPSSVDITIQVIDTATTAIGTYIKLLTIYLYIAMYSKKFI